MKRTTKIALLTATAGMFALGLAGLSNARAASSTVDTAITADATTQSPPTGMLHGPHGQERLSEMAKQLGMTTTELQTELDSGKEMYQIAAAHGLTYDKLKSQRDTDMKARLDDMVKVGYLTQAEADSQWTLYQTKSAGIPMVGMGGGHEHGGRF